MDFSLNKKKCKKCNIEKNLDSFHNHKNGYLGKEEQCKACKAIYDKNPIRAAKRKKQRKQWGMNRAEIIRSFKNIPCIDCGIKYPYYAMQFDHIKELGEKSFNLSHRPDKKDMTDIYKEIAKCQVVCANCHAIRTYKRMIKQEVNLYPNHIESNTYEKYGYIIDNGGY